MFQRAAQQNLPRHRLGRARQLSQHPDGLPATRRAPGLARRPFRGIARRNLSLRQLRIFTPNGCRTSPTRNAPTAACRTSRPPTGRFIPTMSSWPSSGVIIPEMLREQFDDTRNHRAPLRQREKMDGLHERLRDATASFRATATATGACRRKTSRSSIRSDPNRITDKTLLATSYFYYDCKLMEKYATMLGKTDDAQHFTQLAEKIKAAFNEKFLDRDTRPIQQRHADFVRAAAGVRPRAGRYAREDFRASRGQD